MKKILIILLVFLNFITYGQLTRGPYMTTPTSTTNTIQWRTSNLSSSEVKYGTNLSNLSFSISNTTLVTDHIITLVGLTPNTKYYYSIGSIGNSLQGNASNFFYTAPINNSNVPVKFWVTGDFGNGSSNQINVRNSFTSYVGTSTINGWIWLGDNAYNSGTDAEYQSNVFNIYTSIFKNIPLFPVLGNHDYANVGYLSGAARGIGFPYFNIFTLPTNGDREKYYSTNYGNIHFIALDSYGSYNTVGSAMYNWLQSDLASNTQLWTIVYFHHPPYSKGSHNSDSSTELIDMRTNIIPLLEQYGVDVVLSGHSHAYERSFFLKGHFGLENSFNNSMKVQPGDGISTPYTKSSRTGPGTVYVVCGVGGQVGGTSSGYPHNAMQYSTSTTNGSLILNINGNTLNCKFLTSEGSIPDQFSIIKNIPTLPIRLVWFHTSLNDRKTVDIDWTTASETNNEYFIVERTTNFEDIEVVNYLPGAGNSNNLVHYNSIDLNPMKGISYYRLKQIDYDGNSTYSDWSMINIYDDHLSINKIYPNPTNYNINIEFDNLSNQTNNISFKIFNVVGEIVYEKTKFIDSYEKNTYIIQKSELNYVPGIYYISITYENGVKIYSGSIVLN